MNDFCFVIPSNSLLEALKRPLTAREKWEFKYSHYRHTVRAEDRNLSIPEILEIETPRGEIGAFQGVVFHESRA